MKSFGPYIDEAIPHEAGHALIGKAVGLPAKGVDVEVTRHLRGITVSDFAAIACDVPDDQIAEMDLELKSAFILLIAGGVAGNRYLGKTTTGQEADSDRKALSRFTNQSLEAVAEMAVELIHTRRRAFRRLISVIRKRFEILIHDRNLQTGRHLLLTEQELDAVISKP